MIETLTDPPGVRVVPDRASGTGVLVLSGSSGRIEQARAERLAAAGAEAVAIRWFGGPGQQPGPWEVPIELFAAQLELLRARCDRVAMLGSSFGAEAALVTAARTPDVAATIAIAPTDVVWAGVRPDGTQTSHWTVEGAATPYVPLVSWTPTSDPPSFRGLYERSWSGCGLPQRARATIATDRIGGAVILVAGGDDQVWPSLAHAERIAERRAGVGLATTVITDREAGHRLVLPGETKVTGGLSMARGGNPSADARLGQRAWPAIRTALGLHLDR